MMWGAGKCEYRCTRQMSCTGSIKKVKTNSIKVMNRPCAMLVFPCPLCPVSGLSVQTEWGWTTSGASIVTHLQLIPGNHGLFFVPALVFATALRKDFCDMVLGFLFWTLFSASSPACHTKPFLVCLPAPVTHWNQPWTQAAQSDKCFFCPMNLFLRKDVFVLVFFVVSPSWLAQAQHCELYWSIKLWVMGLKSHDHLWCTSSTIASLLIQRLTYSVLMTIEVAINSALNMNYICANLNEAWLGVRGDTGKAGAAY